MFEWIVASLLLLALVILLSRRGHRHLLAPGLGWGAILLGGGCAWMIESLPFTAFRAPLSVTSAIAVVVGLLTGRMTVRAMQGWGRGHERDVAAGAAPADARIVHPVLGAGLFVLGVPLLYTLVALRHESLEIQMTPRDASTGVVLGGEDLRLPGDPAVSHGVLLLHGFLGSPADFGDLPRRLQAKGLTVRVLRLPGHATGPSVLDEVTPDEYGAAVQTARDELAATHARVSIVGFSFGGALALREAAERKPWRLVLVNPWLGQTATPGWCPIETDTLMDLAARVTRRVIRPPGMNRCNDPEGRASIRAYSTVRTQASAAARNIARSAAAVKVGGVPTLLLTSTVDHTVRPDATTEWTAGRDGPIERKFYERSDHVLFHDFDREAAITAVEEFLTSAQ